MRKCSVCGKKVPQYTQCTCELKKRLENYKDYQKRRLQDEAEKERVSFYQSKEWEQCRDNVARHQYNLDLLEWSKGNIIQAEIYHHVIEVRESKDTMLDMSNIIGLTKANHNKVHYCMNQSKKEKEKMQNQLKEILKDFEHLYCE